MACNKEIIEVNELDELNDIYPCKKYDCNKFHKSMDKYEALEDAINYLKPQRVKELLDNSFSKEELSNPECKLNKLNKLNHNLLESTISKIISCGGDKGIPCIDIVNVFSFGNSRYRLSPNEKISSVLFLEIIEIIAQKHPWMINSKCYCFPINYCIYPLFSILNKYYIADNEANKKCEICGSKYQEQLIAKPCALASNQNVNSYCANKYVHLLCLIHEIKTNNIDGCGDICNICSQPYNSYIYDTQKINFPKLNIYIQPLMSRYVFIEPDNKIGQLIFACIYLIVERVKEILDTIDDKEFIELISKYSINDNIHSGVFVSIHKGVIVLGKNLGTNLGESTNPKEYQQINEMLINKCLDVMEYSCETNTSVFYGKYLWCGNTSSPKGSCFTLVNTTNNNKDPYDTPFSHVLLLELNLNPKLRREVDFIDVYDENGGLYGYNTEIVKNQWKNFKKINETYIGKELKIVFSKVKELTKEQQEIEQKRLMRTPREPIYEITVKIPELKIYGSQIECNICLNDVNNETNKYVSPCGHLFHLDCIFKYFETANLLYPVYTTCKNNCCGANKVKQFNCVVCKKLITY